MYLKYIRDMRRCGKGKSGKIYTVHFQPNEKGGYNEQLTIIGGVHETVRGEGLPLALIYAAGVSRAEDGWRIALGRGGRQSLLQIIDGEGEPFVTGVLRALCEREEVRIEVEEKAAHRYAAHKCYKRHSMPDNKQKY